MEELWDVNMKRLSEKEIMEKRPNTNQIEERYNEQFDDRYFRIMLGIACVGSAVYGCWRCWVICVD